MKIRSLILTGIAVLVFGACAPTFNVTLGSMPTQDPGAKIEAGMTTRDDVVQLYGQPDFTGINEDGLLKWTWTHLGIEATPGKEATITSFFNLEVSFDGDLVNSYSYSKKRTE